MKGFAFSLQRVEQRFLSIRWRSHLPVLAGRVIGPSTSAARGLCPLLAQHYNVTALQTRSFSDLAQQDTVTGKSTPHVGKLSPREGVREALSMIQKSRDFKGAASLLTQIVSRGAHRGAGIGSVVDNPWAPIYHDLEKVFMKIAIEGHEPAAAMELLEAMHRSRDVPLSYKLIRAMIVSCCNGKDALPAKLYLNRVRVIAGEAEVDYETPEVFSFLLRGAMLLRNDFMLHALLGEMRSKDIRVQAPHLAVVLSNMQRNAAANLEAAFLLVKGAVDQGVTLTDEVYGKLLALALAANNTAIISEMVEFMETTANVQPKFAALEQLLIAAQLAGDVERIKTLIGGIEGDLHTHALALLAHAYVRRRDYDGLMELLAAMGFSVKVLKAPWRIPYVSDKCFTQGWLQRRGGIADKTKSISSLKLYGQELISYIMELPVFAKAGTWIEWKTVVCSALTPWLGPPASSRQGARARKRREREARKGMPDFSFDPAPRLFWAFFRGGHHAMAITFVVNYLPAFGCPESGLETLRTALMLLLDHANPEYREREDVSSHEPWMDNLRPSSLLSIYDVKDAKAAFGTSDSDLRAAIVGYAAALAVIAPEGVGLSKKYRTQLEQWCAWREPERIGKAGWPAVVDIVADIFQISSRKK